MDSLKLFAELGNSESIQTLQWAFYLLPWILMGIANRSSVIFVVNAILRSCQQVCVQLWNAFQQVCTYLWKFSKSLLWLTYKYLFINVLAALKLVLYIVPKYIIILTWLVVKVFLKGIYKIFIVGEKSVRPRENINNRASLMRWHNRRLLNWLQDSIRHKENSMKQVEDLRDHKSDDESRDENNDDEVLHYDEETNVGKIQEKRKKRRFFLNISGNDIPSIEDGGMLTDKQFDDLMQYYSQLGRNRTKNAMNESAEPIRKPSKVTKKGKLKRSPSSRKF